MAATAGILNGTDLCVYNGALKIAYSQTCKLNLSLDMRDTSNKDTIGWKKVLPGMKNWSAEVSGLVALDVNYNYSYLMNLILNSTSVAVKFKTANSDDYYYSGAAYLQTVSIDAGNQANVTYSATFVGDGALAVTAGGGGPITYSEPPGGTSTAAPNSYYNLTQNYTATLTLPAIATMSGVVVVKNTSATGVITISPQTGEKIDSKDVIYVEAGQSLTLFPNGTEYTAAGSFSESLE